MFVSPVAMRWQRRPRLAWPGAHPKSDSQAPPKSAHAW